MEQHLRIKGQQAFISARPMNETSQQDWKLTEFMEDAAVIGGCFETVDVVRAHWTKFSSNKLDQI